MFSVNTLLEQIKKGPLVLTDETLQELNQSENLATFYKVVIRSNQLTPEVINFINTNLIVNLSSLGNNHGRCSDLIMYGDTFLWNYILTNFNDHEITSLIVCLYICISSYKINEEYILKLYSIILSDDRASELFCEIEIFYDNKADNYVNNYNTFLGILMKRVSRSDKNYDSRVQKISDLFLIILKNRIVKPIFISWLGNLFNSSKNFMNNFKVSPNYSRGILDCEYFKLLMDVLFNLWESTKKKKKSSFENIDMYYYNNEYSIINIEKKDRSDLITNKFMNDLFFSITFGVSAYFNNLEVMRKEYLKILEDMRIRYKQLSLTGYDSDLLHEYLDKITECNLECSKIDKCLNDKRFNESAKKIQKDMAIIINQFLKKKQFIPDLLLEANIDLMNILKLFEDNFYNNNFINFENSVILLNYEYLRNPFVRHKYCFYASYYITDNTSKNICDLRFKSIEYILIPNLIKFYLDMEDHNDESFYEKPVARSNIINFLNFITFSEPYIYGSQIKEYAKQFDTNFIRFVNLYINDLSSFFDETFEIIGLINDFEKREIYVSIDRNYDNYPEHHKLLEQYKFLKIHISNINNMLSFLNILSSNAKNILVGEELGVKYCSQINYCINQIIDKRKRCNIKNKSAVDYNPTNILYFFIKILMVLDDTPNFIGYMAQDTISFKRKNIIFAIGKLWGKKLITESEYVRIDNLGKKIEECMSQE